MMRKNFGKKTWMYPLPVLIVGTYDENGKADAMNAAWGGIYDTNRVILCLSATHRTTKNIKAKGAFTVSFADAAHVAAADYVGIASGMIRRTRWNAPASIPPKANSWTPLSLRNCR